MRTLSILFNIILFSSFTQVATAEVTLDSLLKKVQEGAVQTREVNKAREAEFMSKKNEQAALLKKAKAELARLERESEQLKTAFEANEKAIIKVEGELNIAKGTLGEMFGVVRQVAGEMLGQVQASVTSAEITGRKPFLLEMSKAQSLPGIPELEKLWFELQREMTATGKVASFKSEVVQPNGESAQKTVTRIGAFNLVAEGDYLEYQGSTGQILTLGQQPSSRWTGLIDDFEEAGAGFTTFGVDPSRGAILGMLVQTPSLTDRVNQGGVVGYIILALLLIGLMIVGERFVVLNKLEKDMKAQLASEKIDEANPLGQIMAAFQKYKTAGLETLELKLDEAIIKATPKIKRGITTIKILSGVAPLLGLLGTVTGMILTFQTITLFGTGDPKLMAGGISQALMTTVLGLVCAIPLILLHNFISSKSQRMVQILEEESVGLLAAKEEGALS
jgi:biopolymer transport protein ExbB